MADDKYTSDKLIDYKYLRSSPSNTLSLKIDNISADLRKGGQFQESNVSILARALAVTTGSGLIISSRFRR